MTARTKVTWHPFLQYVNRVNIQEINHGCKSTSREKNIQ